MDDSCKAMSKTRARAITSGNADRYIANETSSLTAGERSLLQLLKTWVHWDSAKRGTLKSIALSVGKMAECQGVSKSTIRRRLTGLRDAGEIVAIEQFSPEGRQLSSEYIFPKLTVWLNELKVSKIVEALTAGGDLDEEQVTTEAREGVTSETPIKQGSYSKKNTYMRFSSKEDFLSVTGSVRYVPQLLGIIRKMRPGIDPDVIFRFFREWISKDGFILKSGKTYIGLLFQFAKWCKIPYVNGFDPSKAANKAKTKAEPKPDYSAIEPKGDGLLDRIRRGIFEHSPAAYRSWFHDADFSVDGEALIYTGKTSFMNQYVQRTYDQFLRHLAASEGLIPRYAT